MGEEARAESEETMPAVPAELPLLPLKDTIVYPLTVYPLVIGKERSIRLINDVTTGDRILALSALRRPETEVTGLSELFTVGTIARILQMIKVPDGTLRVLVQGIERISLTDFLQTEPYIRAKVSALPESFEKTAEWWKVAFSVVNDVYGAKAQQSGHGDLEEAALVMSHSPRLVDREMYEKLGKDSVGRAGTDEGFYLVPAWATTRYPEAGAGYLDFDAKKAEQYTEKKAEYIARIFLEAVRRWDMMDGWK